MFSQQESLNYDPCYYFTMNHALIAEAICLSPLDPEAALKTYNTALRPWLRKNRRDQGTYLAKMALAYLRRINDPQMSAKFALASLLIARATYSIRTMRLLHMLHEELAPHDTILSVHSFRRQMADLFQKNVEISSKMLSCDTI
jgi:hypothetical protein